MNLNEPDKEEVIVKKTTMRDIAKAVGTSAVTVSKAISGKPGMSEKLRGKILRKAEEMGYQYGGKSRVVSLQHLDIGILIPERYFQEESFYSVIYKKLILKLSERGHFGLLEILKEEDEAGLALPNLVRSDRAQGLILLGEPTKAYYRMTSQTDIPKVFLDFYDEQGKADCVVGDNSYGSYRLTSHLIRRGHQRIGFVGNRKATGSIMDRYLGYYRAMLVNNLPVREEWILNDRPENGALIEEPELPAELPTAFVCNCDLTAKMMIEALNRKGLRVPQDISVTGFDDFTGGQEVLPALSTFRVDTDTMVELAVKSMVERCSGAEGPFRRVVVSGMPIYRDSERSLNGNE